ncbi:MAG TPA: DUF2723 domain-containing protein [bacterium]|nr:DUF2723 domain-containing protein [bacterium]
MSYRDDRQKNIISAAVFFFGLVLYIGTTLPDVGWGDSADFVLCAHFLGVAHPTGYPVVTLLGKLLTLIPVGTLAFRVGLISAFVCALLLGVFFRLACESGRSVLLGLYATFVLASSTFLWKQAVTLEVYTLNLFFCTLLLLLMLPGSRRFASLIAFFLVGALGLGNHGTLVFPALMIGVIGLVIERRRFGQAFVTGGFMIMIGLAAYLSLPLFSARTDLLDWNRTELAANFPMLLSGLDFWVIGEYKIPVMWETTKQLAYSVAAQTSLPWLLGFFAAFFVRGVDRLQKWMLFGVLVLTAFFPIMYPTHEKEAFFLIAFSVFLLIGVLGLSALVRKFPGVAGKKWVHIAVVALIIIHSGWLLNRNSNIAAAGDDTARVYTEMLLKTARRDAVIFLDHVADDTIAPPLYYQMGLGRRQDVFLFHRLYLAFPWYRDYMRDRAAEQGHGIVIPDVDMEAEKNKNYRITAEEYARLKSGKTMNTVAIDIQTKKIWEANMSRFPMYINTTSRFRHSVLSEDVPFEPSGFMFALNGKHKEKEVSPPAPAPGIFNALVADHYIQMGFWYDALGRYDRVVSSFESALEYHEKGPVYCALAEACAANDDLERSRFYRERCNESRLQKYDLF